MLKPCFLKDCERQVAGKVVHDSVQDICFVVVAVKASLKAIGSDQSVARNATPHIDESFDLVIMLP